MSGNRKLVFDPAASEEAEEARDWYASKNPVMRDRFLSDLRTAVLSAAEHPFQWPEVEPGFRRVLLRRFPYAVLYTVTSEQVEIIAVMHHRRRPGYWRRRH